MLVSFSVTRQCNLSCPHCYSESIEEPHPDELSTGEAKALITDIAQLGTRMIIFDGGEPTLRDDLPELTSHASEVGLAPLLGTNGMIDSFDENKIKLLQESGLKAAAISLDGAEAELHDTFRGLKGAFAKTIEGIKACSRVGLAFQIGTAVHKNNVAKFSKVVDLARELGANAVEVFDYVPAGRGTAYDGLYELALEERKSLIREVIEHQKKEDELYFRVIGVPQYWVEVEKSIQDEETLKFVRSCCGAGTRYATILYDGTVFPCMLLPIPLGNIREQSFSDIWISSPVLQDLRDRSKLKGKCGKCQFKEVCSGARCRAYAKTGDYLAADPACWYPSKEVI